MDHHQRTLRLGAALIACALVVRLADAPILQKLSEVFANPKIASLLIYLETGRNVRFSPSPEDSPVFALESAIPDFARAAAEPPLFTPEQAQTVEIRYNCSRRPDLGDLISRPLSWDLTGPEPTVLILHTHATESYTRSEGEAYQESAAFRTLDEGYNMLRVGEHLAQALSAGGIHVIQDRTLHDYPSYNGSYNHSRKTVQKYLEEYPSIRLVLDLHRDASGDNRNQLRTHCTVAGKDSAQLMLVVGSDAGGLKHPAWEENLALALKLQVTTDAIAPGIMRYVNLRGQRFNQDLLPGMLLVEVGAAGNTHPEALLAVEVLAQGILELAKGTSTP